MPPGRDGRRDLHRLRHRPVRFDYRFSDLARRRVAAPVTIFRAQGDGYSFIENASGYSATPPTVVDLDTDHYGLLKEPGSDELVSAIRRRLTTTKEHTVPHVNIKHFPKQLTAESRSELVTAVTAAVQRAFDVDSGVVSISLEPVEPTRWNEVVYLSEIVERKDLLDKAPEY